jgi:hypothetical protein
MVLPLDRRVARRSAVVGAEVATTATLADLLPMPPTAVVVVPSEVDFPAIAERVGSVARGLLAPDDEMLTVGAACPVPVEPGSAGDLCLYNVHVEALTEALVESVAAAERGNLATLHGNHVLLVQRFAPPQASAVVHASHLPRVAVRISGRWGLTEGRMPADVYEVAEDGRAVREQLALKPTANITAHGGTRTVELSVRCRSQSSLSKPSVLRLAAQARDAAVAVGHPLSLDVAMYDESPIILRCRPSL